MKPSKSDSALLYTPLPDVFKSSLTGKPFELCKICDSYLLKDDIDYLIEKVFVYSHDSSKTEVFGEYAICISCYEKRYQTMSADSLKHIENYFKANVDFNKRRTRLLNFKKKDLNNWISTCLITNLPVEEGAEYQLVAHCKGESLVLDSAPFIISASAIEELWELLSAETKDILNNEAECLDETPPELKNLLREVHIQFSNDYLKAFRSYFKTALH